MKNNEKFVLLRKKTGISQMELVIKTGIPRYKLQFIEEGFHDASDAEWLSLLSTLNEAYELKNKTILKMIKDFKI